MIEHILCRLEPQTTTLLINANRNTECYKAYGYPLLTDTVKGYAGPLAGMLSALVVVKTNYLLTVPCDCPLLPETLTLRMFNALEQSGANACVVSTGGRLQPVFLLLHRHLAPSLSEYLNDGGRKIATWLEQQYLAQADFSDQPNA